MSKNAAISGSNCCRAEVFVPVNCIIIGAVADVLFGWHSVRKNSAVLGFVGGPSSALSGNCSICHEKPFIAVIFASAACIVCSQLAAMSWTSTAVSPISSMQPPGTSDGPPVGESEQSLAGLDAHGS
jgi:hypothetical protein